MHLCYWLYQEILWALWDLWVPVHLCWYLHLIDLWDQLCQLGLCHQLDLVVHQRDLWDPQGQEGHRLAQ